MKRKRFFRSIVALMIAAFLVVAVSCAGYQPVPQGDTNVDMNDYVESQEEVDNE